MDIFLILLWFSGLPFLVGLLIGYLCKCSEELDEIKSRAQFMDDVEEALDRILSRNPD